jgi:hypothetical protein
VPVQNLVVAGKSGAGKQPRIDVLTEKYGLVQLSTGNIFREYLGVFKKVREGARSDGLFDVQTGVFAANEAIAAALEGTCAVAGVPVDAAVLGFKVAQYVDRRLFDPDAST